jgi:hypothetical protein
MGGDGFFALGISVIRMLKKPFHELFQLGHPGAAIRLWKNNIFQPPVNSRKPHHLLPKPATDVSSPALNPW